jgi:prevent-host-death family protein
LSNNWSAEFIPPVSNRRDPFNKMKTAIASDLRDNCSSLLEWVKRGEEVVITQDGKPVARLVPAEPKGNSAQAPAATCESKDDLK